MNAIDPPWTTLVDAASLAAALAAAAPRLLDARATASTAPRRVDARFALADPQNIVRAVMGEPVGTVVTK